MDWKFLLGLELDDPGFDASVLSLFRARVIEHGLEQRTLKLVLQRLRELGLQTAGGRQRTDSTHVLAAVWTLNRTEFVGETLLAALDALAVAAATWLSGLVTAEWASATDRAWTGGIGLRSAGKTRSSPGTARRNRKPRIPDRKPCRVAAQQPVEKAGILGLQPEEQVNAPEPR
ncbi:transposase [Streptomyces sp. R39]|uniref:Transposase n=1 Tax=Streptomyces sp. R39 TaxID=3238631 RepID=A0AB39QGX9_9ACTN